MKEEINDFVYAKQLDRGASKAEAELLIEKNKQALEKAKLEDETKAAVQKVEALSGPFAEAVVAMQNQDILVKVTEASSINSWLGVDNIVEMFKDSPMEDRFKNILDKSLKAQTRKESKA